MADTLSAQDLNTLDAALEAIIRDLQKRHPNVLRSELIAVMRERLTHLALRSLKPVRDAGALIG
jgi:hypothetical protein